MVKPASLAEELRVKDIMSSPVIDADVEETAEEVANKMVRYGIGSVVVTEKGFPVGIITKRDLVYKVVAKNLKPNEVKAKDIMSSPIHVANPDDLIDNALREMNKLKIDHLAVVHKDKLVGIISTTDILQVTPEILEIVREKMRMGNVKTSGEGYTEGFCDACGEWSDMLLRVNDQYLCEDCRMELETRGGEES
ncbi:MAG: CBS domain-containing protein [Thaumarchaeota archaeon]|jgi:CBS domain-containing protein|nr:CBS domain-containing protein [Candidatus Terraquivivens yellowstonensis]MCL7387957.1 CBS domain-containing protein [Candidatus Terraquivivens yellowstonensis]MCL7392521.1 CBS domain-containing protein [Candidatus Terraquivivens yellowstonensis]MCL7398194.1 CBS domain-containing protein [Candidatus Terraquivivens yellowstonensis]MCL7399751.1 CBS domain-containing protein [Candidatus Terraquivivens yellowstonensis]